MRRFFAAALMVLTASTLIAGSSDDDLKFMQGSWTATVIEAGGKPPPDDKKDFKVKLVVKGNLYTVFFNDKQIVEGTLKLDAKKKPKAIDAVAKEGPVKDKVQPGIYEIKGDEMRVLFAQPGDERPTEFKTKEGSMDVLLSYKRVKEEKKK